MALVKKSQVSKKRAVAAVVEVTRRPPKVVAVRVPKRSSGLKANPALQAQAAERMAAAATELAAGINQTAGRVMRPAFLSFPIYPVY